MAVHFSLGYALLIGVGADLPNTITDAEGLAAILRDEARCAYPPAQTQTLTGERATRADILTALDQLAQSTPPEATVVVYFSGHGYEVQTPTGPMYYLIPYGAEPHRLTETAISGQEFVARLAALAAQKILILLDCCHAGGLGDWETLGPASKAPMPAEAHDWLAKGSGRVLIASSRANELSYAGTPYSQFTLALIEALCGEGAAKADGYVRVADLALHAREVVSHRTKYRQRPLLHFEHADNFVVAYYAAGNAKTLGTPTHIPRAPAEAKTGPGPLPPPPPDFTGREAELAALLALTKKYNRLGLCGAGGAGKSTLALKLAEEIAPQYPDAQIYVDFQGATKKKRPLSSAQALIEIIRAFEPSFTGAHQSPDELRARYLRHMAEGRNILFFDNVRRAAQIEPLLPGKNCVVLITSHLHLTVPGMATQTVGALPPAEAQALVLKIAERVGPHAEALAEACGYLPYAIRLAASTLNNQSNLDPAHYARRLHDTRQQLELVPASLTCAYELVSKAQQKLWRVLAAFPGEFDQPAAELVWGLGPEAAMETLGVLVEYNLLEWNAATRRYRLHDVARAFARSPKDPTPAVIQRLRRLLKRRAQPEATRRTAALWLTRLHWLDALTPPPAEMLAYLDLVIRAMDAPADLAYLERQTSAALKRAEAATAKQTRVRLLVNRAILRGQLNRLEEAEKDYSASSKLAPASGLLAAQIAFGVGNIASIRGERDGDRAALERALMWYRKALTLARAAKADVILETSIGKEMGFTHALLRQWPEAEAACTEALTTLRARFHEVADPLLAVRHQALLLETAASAIHFEKSRSRRPKTGPLAQQGYTAALALIQEEIEILTSASLESDALAVAYENAGDCLLALSECEGGTPDQRIAACAMWRRAVDLALRLGIHDIVAEDTERLKRYCS